MLLHNCSSSFKKLCKNLLIYKSIIRTKIKSFHVFIKHSNLDFKQYQQDGLLWCLNKELCNYKGGFLCDEMGLGKTIMITGLIYSNFYKKTLIVVPKILVEQWFNEIFKTTGHKSLIITSQNSKKINIDDINKEIIIITTYNFIINKKSNVSNIIRSIKWNRIVFDEAHELRNLKTLKYKFCFKLKSNIRWFVSGTIIQNKINDLNNIIILGRFDKLKYFDTNKNYKIFMLKRTKKSVGIIISELTTHTYNVKWNNIDEKLLSKDIHKGLLLVNTGRGKILEKIIRSRQCCIFPALVKPNLLMLKRNDKTKIIKNEYINGLNFGSKLNFIIDKIVERKNNNNGKIIFAYFNGEIEYLYYELTNKGFYVLVLNGQNNKKNKINEKNKNVDILNTPCDILIIQIQIGSTGLNLQKYFNEIYFTGVHWNPYIEEQAIARCYRIGQTKPVYVYKFVMDNFYKNKNYTHKNEHVDNIVNLVDLDNLDNPDNPDNVVSIENYICKIQNIKKQLVYDVLENEISS